MKISLKSNNCIKLFPVKDLFTKIIRHDKIVIIFVEAYFRGIEETVCGIVCFKKEYYLIQLLCNLSLETFLIQSGRILSAMLVHQHTILATNQWKIIRNFQFVFFPHDVTITFQGRKSKYTFIKCKHVVSYNDLYWLAVVYPASLKIFN